MANSLSNLINNLSEVIHRIKCKCRHDDKKCEIRVCFLQYMNFRDNLIEYKCLMQYFDEKLKERCLSTSKYSNNDNNKFIILLQKDVSPYEYTDY